MTDEIFAMTGTGYGTALIIGIRSGTDHRRIADTSPFLFKRTAGTGSGCQVSLLIQDNATDRSVLPAFLLQLIDPFQRFGSSEIHIIINQLQSLFGSKSVSSRTTQHNMRRLCFNGISGIDRVLYRLNSGNRSGREILPFHNGGIQFESPFGRTGGTLSGIE